MTKLKAPLLSLSASKQIAGSITFRRSRGQNISSVSQPPTYRRTLPQLYQRWLFSDARWWWHSLTQSQKDSYRAGASQAHMTAYAYAVRYYLRNLPDVAARWRLDSSPGNSVPDSGPHGNTATKFGPVYQPGLFGQCLSFDGSDDYVNGGNDPSLLVGASHYTIDLFLKTTQDTAGYYEIIEEMPDIVLWWRVFYSPNEQKLWYQDDGGPIRVTLKGAGLLHDGKWHHIAAVQNFGTDHRLYIDGLLAATAVDNASSANAGPLYLGKKYDQKYFDGELDHVTIYTRVLSAPQLLEHANRRLN